MKRSPRLRSTASNLSESVHQQLNMYAIAAGAAGVGLLALAQPVEAEVVYTPAHVTFTKGTFYYLDLDNDGTAEVILHDTAIFQTGNGLFALEDGNGVASVQFQSGFAAGALNRGETIGPGKTFFGTCISTTGCTYGHVLAGALRSNGHFGAWVNVTDRYLGIRFHVSGKTYYGWARLTVRAKQLSVTGELTGYAYENIPNHPIRAGQTSGSSDDVEASPESSSPTTQRRAPSAGKPISQGLQPATPGMLALGAQGVPLWRREESVLEGN